MRTINAILIYIQVESYIAPTCFGVTPSSGSSTPIFKNLLTIIDYKVIHIILQYSCS
jgi:hypothetical protein